MRIKPFSKLQLGSFKENLRRDLNAVLAANASGKKKLDKLSSPEYLKKYTNEALAAMRREAIEEESKIVLNIIKSLPTTRKLIEQQREYWDEHFWRDAKLNPEPQNTQVNTDAYLTTSEKAVQSLANFTSLTNATLLENSSRTWLIQELDLMGAEGFIKVVQDASESGDAAVLYLARLIFESKVFHSEEERSKASAALFTAEKDIQLPIRSDSLDILQTCSELAEDIESAWISLSTGKEDIRSKVRPYAEERKAKEAAEKAVEEKSKQRLQNIEDNLLIRNHI